MLVLTREASLVDSPGSLRSHPEYSMPVPGSPTERETERKIGKDKGESEMLHILRNTVNLDYAICSLQSVKHNYNDYVQCS